MSYGVCTVQLEAFPINNLLITKILVFQSGSKVLNFMDCVYLHELADRLEYNFCSHVCLKIFIPPHTHTHTHSLSFCFYFSYILRYDYDNSIILS